MDPLPDEAQPLLSSSARSRGTAKWNEMEDSPRTPIMQFTTPRSEKTEGVLTDKMENSLGTSDLRSTSKMSQPELKDSPQSKNGVLEMYNQHQEELGEDPETDHIIEDDLVHKEPSIGSTTEQGSTPEQRCTVVREMDSGQSSKHLEGDFPCESSPEITIPFDVGEKVIFTEDLSDCEVKKGDCGEVVSLMKKGLVIVRTNNLATEVKVDHTYLKQATVYQVRFSTGICGFGVVPGSRNKNAFVGPTLQSEQARRAVLSGSQIVKINSLNVEVGYSCREIKRKIKTFIRPIWITFKWDKEKAEALFS